jgi:hypothetical protein
MTGPARITIELEPPRGRRGRWAARTRVEERPGLEERTRVAEPFADESRVRASVPETPVHVPQAREPVIIPVGYEPPTDCTCLDGYCDADHANE